MFETHSIARWSVDNESADKSVTTGAIITDVNKLLATGIFYDIKLWIIGINIVLELLGKLPFLGTAGINSMVK